MTVVAYVPTRNTRVCPVWSHPPCRSKLSIKNCSDCTFYVYSAAPVLISDCTYLRFAEYNAVHPKLDAVGFASTRLEIDNNTVLQLFQATGLLQQRNRWRDIKDSTAIKYGVVYQLLGMMLSGLERSSQKA